jgi:hypothetical protein
VLLSQKVWWTVNSPAATGASRDNPELDGYGFACSVATCTDGEDQQLQAPAPAEGVEGSEVTGGKGATTLVLAWRRGNSRRCAWTWSRRQLGNGSGWLGDDASVEVWTKHSGRWFWPDSGRQMAALLAPYMTNGATASRRASPATDGEAALLGSSEDLATCTRRRSRGRHDGGRRWRFTGWRRSAPVSSGVA